MVIHRQQQTRMLALLLLVALLAACQGGAQPGLPTSALAAATTTSEQAAGGTVPATYTIAPPTVATPGHTPLPTRTPRPTRTTAIFPTTTLEPTNTPEPSPTGMGTPTSVGTLVAATETPTLLPTSTSAPAPSQDANLLPNPSFEGGWYHIGGLPELQVPEQWQFEWDEGENHLDEDPAPWVRPECRVLPPDFLPADERDTFIWDGEQTVKIFKGSGAVSFRLTTQVTLQPGTYRLEINVFPDLVVGYDENGKVWAPDPLSGEVRLIAGDRGTGWMLPAFGQKNTFNHVFTIDSPQTIHVGAALRGRWAIQNNGWFMDDWGLFRVQ